MIGRPWLAAAALLAASFVSGCGARTSQTEEQEAQTQPAGTDSGRVVLPAGAAEKAGIAVGRADSAIIEVTMRLPGEVKADSTRLLVVRPRFPGVVRGMRKQVGQSVSRGEGIAVIQSNESLTDYAVPAGISGTIVDRTATPGQTVTADSPLYTIIDLSDVWVEFAIYPHMLGAIRPGERVRVVTEAETIPTAQASVSYVGPRLGEDTRVSVGRVVLPNPARRWRPGLFVTVEVVTQRAPVRVAVPDDAIVRTPQGSAVFVADRGGYRIRTVVPGRSDGRRTEIVSGLEPGATVVVRGAFVLKAELEKSEYAE